MIRLFALFLIWPIVELYLLIQIGRATNFWFALLLVIAPAMLGAGLARREGFKTYLRIQNELRAGHLPGDSLIEALIIVISGVLLITPGLLSDAVGLLLLLPPIRRYVRDLLKRRFIAKFTVMHFGQPSPFRRPDDDFVDVEVREVNRKPLDRE